MTVRAMEKKDLGWVLALNALHKAELSPLNGDRLTALHRMAFRALVAVGETGNEMGDGAGFLLGFDRDAAYDGANFLWFRARYPRFAYVDRIAVAAEHRRRGHAEALYGAFFAAAQAAGHGRAACEVNLDPPNPGSHRFHAALGFRAVGEGRTGSGKRVRYYIRDLP